VAYLESLSQMSPRDFLDAEGAHAVLERYLNELFINPLALLCDLSLLFLTCFSWLTFSFSL
jgi:hypothetical protein